MQSVRDTEISLFLKKIQYLWQYNVCKRRESICVFLLVRVFFDDLVYRDLESDVLISRMAVVLVDAKFGGSHCFPIGNLSEVKAELLKVSPLVREVLVPLHWGKGGE